MDIKVIEVEPCVIYYKIIVDGEDFDTNLIKVNQNGLQIIIGELNQKREALLKVFKLVLLQKFILIGFHCLKMVYLIYKNVLLKL